MQALKELATDKIEAKDRDNYLDARIIPEDVYEPGQQESGCPKWYPDWSALAELQPRIKLDPNKFLTPILTHCRSLALSSLARSRYAFLEHCLDLWVP
ncbi:unnamed protein product [Oikopleura dioica]|uniref:Uncharacterized protein n=1 Tax=Oikopleura dioica TaxID=34765 RepID=E4YD04_OIKDI|nr:unnamed protein product [Oikopleura dioica]